MAGTGKTSIALTLCRRLRNESGVFFGGGFFCSRSSGFVAQTDVRRILPTLARLMAGISTEFATALMVELSKADRVASKPVRDQIGPLLLQPLSALPEMSVPIVFVIDALDEIADESELAELLELIANFQSVVPLKFILTSRPEMHIRGTSISSPEHNTILRLHEIDSDEVQQDIRTYIDRTLAHTVTGSSWYTSAQVNALVELSNCLFIFASTILKYVLAPGVDAARSVRLSRATSAVSQGTAATATLDKMYQWIVIEASHSDTIDAEELEDLKLILACILTSRSPLTVQALADLMKLEPDILRSSLGRLYAVIYVPEDDVAPGLRAVHASFSDYLFDRAPHHIRIARSLGHETLASACLHLMDQQLHFNISQSQSSYEPNPSTRPDNIPVSLEYACLHWPHHVAAISKPHGYFGWTHSAIYRDIDLKFRPKFLFWLEVLSVLHKVGLAAGLLLIAASAVSSLQAKTLHLLKFAQIQGHSITQFLHDAHSFVASSHEAIERSAPHIYLSALPFADKSSLVFQQFFPRHTGLITVEAFGIDRHGGRAVMTLTGHSGAVHSVSYSCDGRLLASGSLDGTVRVWDTRTGGEALAPLRSGDGSVLSVNFASNNKWIASGTEDRIVCIWTVTPAHVSPRRLRGHSGAVSAVVFSPDGSRLASASEDTTARLWDPEKGNRLAVVLAHTDCVYGLAFSPDGMVLASASHHSSVRFWNSINGQAVGDPLDRAGAVNLDFSQDGHLIAGSFDDGVALWRWETSEMIAELPADNKTYSVRFSHDDRQLVAASGWGFRLWTLCTDQHGTSWVDLGGHSGQVHSVTFSPDGLYIASASDDCTIRIWTAGSNQSAVQPLSAHSSPVNSVIISFDGAIIVSGSDDGLVRVWNAQTGQAALPPLHGHTGQVNSVAISANGRLIASASTDCSVRLWDAQSGAVVGNPMRHISSVTSVTFTPDGCWIASASVNNVPYLWDITEQPAPALGPLRYHAQASVIAFSLTGKLIAAGDSSGYIHIWNVDTGCLTCRLLHQYSVHSLAFSPGGMRIVSGRENATADMWEVGTGRQMHVLRGHTDTVRSVSWSLDDQFIATGSDDHSVRLWDAMTGAPLATLRGHDGRVNSVTFTPDGQSIVSVSYHSAIRKWDVFKACRLDSERAGKPFAVFTSATFNDGWLVGSSGELYLWVPAEYRKYLQSTPCVLQISRSRVVISSGHSGLHAGSN